MGTIDKSKVPKRKAKPGQVYSSYIPKRNRRPGEAKWSADFETMPNLEIDSNLMVPSSEASLNKQHKKYGRKKDRICKYVGEGPEIIDGSISLYPYQAQIHASTKKILAFIGATGTGKSWYAPRWVYTEMLKYPGEEHIMSAPTIPMMKRTVVKYTKKFLKEKKIPFKYNKNDMVFEVGMDGSLGTIWCISAQEPDRMQGVHARSIVGDEAGKYGKDWIDVSRQRVSFTGGRILLVTTPYSMNWLYKEVYLPWEMGEDQDVECVTPIFLDNPLSSVEEYLRAKDKLPRWKFLMMYHARFTKPAGLIFPKYSTIPRFPIPANWDRGRSIDFGFNNPTGILEFAQSPKTGIWYVYKEYKQSGMDMDQVENILNEGMGEIIGDPSAKQMIKTLYRHGFPIKEGDNAVMPGIASTYSALKKGKLIIFDDMLQLIDELDSYQYLVDEDDGNLTNQPVKYNDHLVDPLRYFWYTHYHSGSPAVEVLDTQKEYKEAVQQALENLSYEGKTLEELVNIIGDDDF